MVKALFIPFIALLFGSSFAAKDTVNTNKDDYRSYLVTSLNERNNYTLESISGFSGSEFRLYHYDDLVIDEISDTAFSGTNFTTLMLTNSVTHITDAVFENAPSITSVKYTGSGEEYNALGLSFSNFARYSCDEGFMNYWNLHVRPNEDSNICDISKTTYQDVYFLYKNLSQEDLNVVNATTDKAGVKISDSMKELVKLFSDSSGSQKTDEWNQTGAITLIIIVAVIGMTSITIFYLLKTKNIIK